MKGKDRTTGYYNRFTPGSGELKFRDIAIADGSVSVTGGVVTNLVAIPQGTGENERIGRKCTIKRIGIKWFTTLDPLNNATESPPGDDIRVIMYLDKQANGTAAQITDVLESDAVLSFNNLANSQRFRTIFDKHICLNRQSMSLTAVASPTVQSTGLTLYGEWYKNVNIPIEYSGTTGILSELRSNNIGMILISKEGQAHFGGQVRMRFSDN